VYRQNLHVVLVRPKFPLNIGAAARAMKNMGVRNLRLIAPECNPYDIYSLRMAHGARDILSHARVYSSLPQALRDMQLVVATSARRSKQRGALLLPEQARELVQAMASRNQVALLFGNEESGMTNEELKHAQHLVHIPCSEEQTSLNLAQAVLLMLYEVTRQSPPNGDAPILAAAGETNDLFAHMERVYRRIGFLKPGREGRMMRKIRRIYLKEQLTAKDVKILRGILRNTEWAIDNL